MLRSRACGPSVLQAQVERDLSLWNATPIGEETMRHAIETAASLTIAWHKGRSYVVRSASSHQRLRQETPVSMIHFAAYLLDMLAVEEAGLVPKEAAAELILKVDDVTMDPATSASRTPAVGRYTRKLSGPLSPSPEIRVPSWAFRVRNFDAHFLGQQLARTAQENPWESKTPVLFGRYAPYPTRLPRRTERNSSATTRATRDYFVRHAPDWVPRSALDLRLSMAKDETLGKRVDSRYTKVDMLHWSRRKYLLCLAGITWSGTCEMLLTLSSVPFIEQSGYQTYYSSSLQPFVHFIPVWAEYPDDVADALAWARADDARARKVAEDARRFAAQHLSLAARECYCACASHLI